MVQIGYLTAKFDADVAKFMSDIQKAGTSLEKLEKTVSGTVKGINGALGALGVTLGAGAVFGRMLDEAKQAESAAKKVEAILRSTGGAAGITAKQVDDLASSMSDLTGIDDDVIKGGQGLLLTFKNIGKDVFPQATQAMLDMSETMGTDLKSSAVQLGKALNDPSEGLKALTRIGITFSDSQKAVIKQFQETGQMAKAQAVILKEVQDEMGGTAAAARDTLEGAFKALDTAWGNLMEALGDAGALDLVRNSIEGLVIIIQQLNTAVSSGDFKHWLNDISTSTQVAYESMRPLINLFDQILTINESIAKIGGIKGPKDLIGIGLDLKAAMDGLAGDGEKYKNRLDKFFEEIEKKRKEYEEKAKKKHAYGLTGSESVAALGLPSDKDLEAYLAQQKRILDTFDLDKVFAEKVQNIAGDQVVAMSKFTNALLDSTKEKITSLEAYKKSLGDSDADKASKKAIDLQLDKYKQLKTELEDQNKELNKQYELVNKVADATLKQAKQWQEETQKNVLANQAAYEEANKASEKQIEDIKQQTEALRQKRTMTADELVEQEALNKLGYKTNDLYFARRKLLQEMKDALSAYKEEVAATRATEDLEKMKEANELLKAQVEGTEQEYEAKKKLKDLLKDIQDPAKIDEITKKYWDQVDATKGYKQALEDQKKTIDAIKSSTDGYIGKLNQLNKAFNDGKINPKQYGQVLEELQKKQLESVKKSTTDFANKVFNAFGQAITEGKKLKDVFKDLGKELGLLAAKKLVFEPIANAIGNYASKLYGGTMFGAPGSGSGVASAGGGGLLAGLAGGGGLLGGIKGLFGGGNTNANITPQQAAAMGLPPIGSGNSWRGKVIGYQYHNGQVLPNYGGGLDQQYPNLDPNSNRAHQMEAAQDQKDGTIYKNGFPFQPQVAGTPQSGSISGSSSGGIGGGLAAGPMSADGWLADIRNTLKYAETGSASGTALRVWVTNFGVDNKEEPKFKNPFSSSANKLKDTGSGGLQIFADNLIPLIASLTTTSSKGLAWKVVNPDCPCGPMGDLKSPSITGGLPSISGGGLAAPALNDPTGALRGAYNPNADQIARANGTYKSPMLSLSGGVSTMPTTGMTGAWGYQQRGLNGTLLPTSGMIGSAPEFDEYMRRAAAMRQAGNFTGVMPTQANFRASSKIGFTGDPFYLTGSPYSAVSATDYAEPPNVTPGFSGGVNKSPMYAKSTATAANTVWNRFSPSGWDNLAGLPYATRDANPATAHLWGSGGSGVTSNLNNWIPDNRSIFSPGYKELHGDPYQYAKIPGFANGGNPPVGIPSIVGERGPELFVPRQSGTVLPNDRLKSIMGGGNTPVVHLHDYTETKSEIGSTRFDENGALHITLRDAVANLQNDPKVRAAASRAQGTKGRGNRRT